MQRHWIAYTAHAQETVTNNWTMGLEDHTMGGVLASPKVCQESHHMVKDFDKHDIWSTDQLWMESGWKKIVLLYCLALPERVLASRIIAASLAGSTM